MSMILNILLGFLRPILTDLLKDWFKTMGEENNVEVQEGNLNMRTKPVVGMYGLHNRSEAEEQFSVRVTHADTTGCKGCAGSCNKSTCASSDNGQTGLFLQREHSRIRSG